MRGGAARRLLRGDEAFPSVRLFSKVIAMRPEIPDEPAEILKARDLDVVPYAPRVGALADRLGLDLSATLDALNAVPLCLPRDRHSEARRDMAGLIAAQAEPLRAALPGLVARHFAPLTRPGRVDAMAGVVAPAVAEVISILVGMSVTVEEGSHISRIFSQTLGVARRKRMDEELARLQRRLRDQFPAADDRTLGLKLSLLILGRDAMMGTFGCSLEDMARRAGGGWSALAWPETPPRTGVPYIDRIALGDVTVGGRPVDKGETIRAALADYEKADDPRLRLSFFGAGAHLCLGRALSLEIWRELGAFLAASPARPRVTAFALRRDDVFQIPESFEMEIAVP